MPLDQRSPHTRFKSIFSRATVPTKKTKHRSHHPTSQQQTESLPSTTMGEVSTNTLNEKDVFGGKVDDFDIWGYDSFAVDATPVIQEDEDFAKRSPSTADTARSVQSYVGGGISVLRTTIEDSGDDYDDFDEFGEEDVDDFGEGEEHEFGGETSDDDDNEAEKSVEKAADDTTHRTISLAPLIPKLRDMAPSRPRRTFEEEYAELKSINNKSKARLRGGRRDELSQSEHVGGALRNLSDHAQGSISGVAGGRSPSRGSLSGTASFRKAFLEDMKKPSNEDASHKPKNRLQGTTSFRVAGGPPPVSRSCKGKRDELSVSEHTGRQRRLCSRNAELSGSMHGQVTLRGPRDRVLLGSNELSTSQHLRRKPPSRTRNHSHSSLGEKHEEVKQIGTKCQTMKLQF